MGPSGPILRSGLHLLAILMRLPAPPSDLPLLAYVATVPALALAFYSGSNHDATRVVQLAVLLLTAAVAMAASLTSAPPAAEPGRRPIGTGLIAALALASAAMSAVPVMALREIALMTGLAGACWITAGRLNATSLARARWAALLGSTLYAFLLALLALSPLIKRTPLDWASLVVGFDNYRFFNHVQTVALPLLAIAALHAADERTARLGRRVAWFSMIVYWAYAFCSGARGTGLAIAAAMAGATMMAGWRATAQVHRTLILSAIGGAVVYAVIFLLLPAAGLLPVGAPAERSLPSLASDSSRLLLWRIAWDDIQALPWLGIGPMHYAHFPNPKAAHPHNVYLQVAAEWGIPMLVILLALAGRALWRFARAVRGAAESTIRAEGGGLLVACLAFLADGFVSGNFVMPVSQMWIVLCCAWTIAWYRRHGPATASPPPWAPVWHRAAAAALLVSQLWLVVDVWPEAGDLRAHLAHVQQDIVRNARTSPRFWSDGWF